MWGVHRSTARTYTAEALGPLTRLASRGESSTESPAYPCRRTTRDTMAAARSGAADRPRLRPACPVPTGSRWTRLALRTGSGIPTDDRAQGPRGARPLSSRSPRVHRAPIGIPKGGQREGRKSPPLRLRPSSRRQGRPGDWGGPTGSRTRGRPEDPECPTPVPFCLDPPTHIGSTTATEPTGKRHETLSGVRLGSWNHRNAGTSARGVGPDRPQKSTPQGAWRGFPRQR